MAFYFADTEIEGVKVITPHQFEDHRGLYKKYYEKNIFAENGIICEFTECSDLISEKGTLRGLHYQTLESQAKLVHVIKGIIFDVALDLREDSATYGKYHIEVMKDYEHKTVYIPEGFAHGFMALKEETIFSYMCSGRYIPEACGGILWNDAELNIPWPIKNIEEVVLSEKDKKAQTFREYCMRK